MKKLMVLAMLLAIMGVVVWSTGALAGSAYSNARANFGPVTGSGVDNAWGHAIINYVKGKGEWQIHGSVHNLAANTPYIVQVGIQGNNVNYVNVATFTTDGTGKANFHNVVSNLLASYDVVRIIDTTQSGWVPEGKIVMVAREDGTIGLLQFRGGERGM